MHIYTHIHICIYTCTHSCLIAEEKDDAGNTQEVKLAQTLAVLRTCQQTVCDAKIEAGLRYASISRSLLPYNRSLLTLAHTSRTCQQTVCDAKIEAGLRYANISVCRSFLCM